MLQQAVLAELSWEPSITAGHIGVTANKGVVTLTGSVDSLPSSDRTKALAGAVAGVKAVDNRLVPKAAQ